MICMDDRTHQASASCTTCHSLKSIGIQPSLSLLGEAPAGSGGWAEEATTRRRQQKFPLDATFNGRCPMSQPFRK
jgi:hypothetical protein